MNGTEITADVALAYNDFWWDRGTKVIGSRRTSLVIDPPDGKIPAMTPAARARVEKLEAARERPAEGPEDRSVGERCLLGFNAGPPFAPGGYNMNVQIVQTPKYVMLMNEMVHTARVIPMDSRPFPNLPQWVGTSRGRWEGDTLVIETKGFKGETSFRGSSPNLHLIEKFTRSDNDTLVYQFTANDPSTWVTSVDGGDPAAPHRRSDLRVRLPRSELRHDQPAEGRTGRRRCGCDQDDERSAAVDS